ncbi:hypothetical protein [Leptospira phage LE3]|uniref:Uncharacterized protein n=2 Tax=Nylescharonvirus TaxID=2843431 RepID=A0A343LEH3_9CAUD|nr:hypothetical protein HWB33_gp72 [Leptospira phage LE3]YP_009835545.1 hypothetical protein HWB34_gp70 [Leptospira phage LE4]ATN95005.1 hypothetical protein [Leptospira phage LE3]ATN95083.1 hypothetical protein [Leptospira phage LE4]
MSKKEIKKAFQWRSREGKFYYPKDMATRHLFYTWLMIWNHSAPKEQKVMGYKSYTFAKFYTPEYMFEAFKQTYFELKSRDDLALQFKEIVEKIESYFLKEFKEKLLEESQRMISE